MTKNLLEMIDEKIKDSIDKDEVDYSDIQDRIFLVLKPHYKKIDLEEINSIYRVKSKEVVRVETTLLETYGGGGVYDYYDIPLYVLASDDPVKAMKVHVLKDEIDSLQKSIKLSFNIIMDMSKDLAKKQVELEGLTQ